MKHRWRAVLPWTGAWILALGLIYAANGFGQSAPRLTEEKVFEIIGRLEVRVQLLEQENAELRAENATLLSLSKTSKGVVAPKEK